MSLHTRARWLIPRISLVLPVDLPSLRPPVCREYLAYVPVSAPGPRIGRNPTASPARRTNAAGHAVVRPREASIHPLVRMWRHTEGVTGQRSGAPQPESLSSHTYVITAKPTSIRRRSHATRRIVQPRPTSDSPDEPSNEATARTEPSGPSWDWLQPPPHARSMAGWALLPLRAFLGFTFVFAGLQKLANPEIFQRVEPSVHPGPDGRRRATQPHSLADQPVDPCGGALGILIALGEIAVGLGTLLGLWTRAAAVGGVLISLMLFLTVSYHSSPYYTGSDIVFVFAWTPLVIAGAGGVLSADAILENRVRGWTRSAWPSCPFRSRPSAASAASTSTGRDGARNGAPCAPAPCPYLIQRPSEVRRLGRSEVDRRTVVVERSSHRSPLRRRLRRRGGGGRAGPSGRRSDHEPRRPHSGERAAPGGAPRLLDDHHDGRPSSRAAAGQPTRREPRSAPPARCP